MIPTAVVLFGKRWTVVQVKKLPGKFGDCNHDLCRVRVREGVAPDHQRDTVLHEFLHAIDDELQLALGEKRVRLTATAVLALLRANPALVAYLMED